MTTRLVAELSEKETALAKALAQGNTTTARSLTTPDFEAIASSDLSQSASLDDLLADTSRHRTRNLNLRDLSARDEDGSVVASFYWDESTGNDKKIRATWMVVDIWKSTPDGLKLKTRFVAPKGNSHRIPPGAPPPEPIIEKRY
jgi:hypothetical protein